MELLQNVCATLWDIAKIYARLACITLAIYFAAEWYIMHYDASGEGKEGGTPPGQAESTAEEASTVNKAAKLLWRFFFR